MAEILLYAITLETVIKLQLITITITPTLYTTEGISIHIAAPYDKPIFNNVFLLTEKSQFCGKSNG